MVGPELFPKISVCIPAYNRPEFLSPLLDSVISQENADFEIVICEDHSPKRDEIRKIVVDYVGRYPEKIHYYENQENLGYDGNLRNLISKAHGDYCFFVGNDDLLCPGALAEVSSGLKRYPDTGVSLRAYASFEGSPGNIVQEFRYFNEERLFPPGADSIVTFFRRSVVISGMVIHRESSVKYSSERFDGTLLYQLYLVCNILREKPGLYLPKIVVLYRNGGIPDFGNSKSEAGKFLPERQTPESSLEFMRGMLKIARWADQEPGVNIFKRVLRDIGNYSYPVLSIQAKQTKVVFIRYAFSLARLGFWKNKMFYLYFLALLFLGTRRVERTIAYIKVKMGRTPEIGKIYRGRSA